MKIHTWLDAGDALKIIELLNALRAALIKEHGDGIKTIMREDIDSVETPDGGELLDEMPPLK